MPFIAAALHHLAQDLGRAADEIATDVKAVVERGAVNIKTQLRAEMAASPHFKGAARSITYDVETVRDRITAEIGPKSGPGEPGALANIAYFGTSRGGGTVPDPEGALLAEGERTADWIDKIAQGVLR